jgi:hypothetical protein
MGKKHRMKMREQKVRIVDASLELLVAANRFYISFHNISTLAFFYTFLDRFNCCFAVATKGRRQVVAASYGADSTRRGAQVLFDC